MTTEVLALSFPALLAATAAIWTDYRGPRLLVYVYRPLTIFFIIGIVTQVKNPAHPAYKILIIAGLGLSLCGDCFMMLKKKRVMEGMLSFLLAHLFYIAAFLIEAQPRFKALLVLPLLIYAAIMLSVLLPRLGKMRVPVAVYILAITAMAAIASGRHIKVQSSKTLLALCGALLFVASDSVWAVNRFVKPFKAAQAVILSTYFVSQWLIAMSV
jgi:uncharacterized membrane protein YhhN